MRTLLSESKEEYQGIKKGHVALLKIETNGGKDLDFDNHVNQMVF